VSRGLGKTQVKLLRALRVLEEQMRALRDKKARLEQGGLTTIELAQQVYGDDITEARRIATSRALNSLHAENLALKIRKPGTKDSRWRLNPKLAAVIPESPKKKKRA
jgi:hypothetical protein